MKLVSALQVRSEAYLRPPGQVIEQTRKQLRKPRKIAHQAPQTTQIKKRETAGHKAKRGVVFRVIKTGPFLRLKFG